MSMTSIFWALTFCLICGAGVYSGIKVKTQAGWQTGGGQMSWLSVAVIMGAFQIGGVSIILYGMISAIGVRNVVENKTNFQESRNVIVAAIILGLAVGINFSEAAGIPIVIGNITINMTGLAVAYIVGIVLSVKVLFDPMISIVSMSVLIGTDLILLGLESVVFAVGNYRYRHM